MNHHPIAALSIVLLLGGCPGSEKPSASDSSSTQEGAGASGEAKAPRTAQRGLVCGTRKGKDVIAMKIPNLERHHSRLGTWVNDTSRDADAVLLDEAAIAAFATKHAEVEEGWHDPRDSSFVGRTNWSGPVTERLSAARAHLKAGEWIEGEIGAIDAAASVIESATDLDELRVMVDTAQIWCLPTTKGTYKPPMDLDFDRNRCSEIHGAELVRVLASAPGPTADQRWFLVDAGYTVGWVTSPSWTPALDEAAVADFVDAKDAVVVVDEVDWPFGDQHPFQHLRVGTRLPRVPKKTPKSGEDTAATAPDPSGATPTKPEELPIKLPEYDVRIPTPTGIETIAVTTEIMRQRALSPAPLAFTRRNFMDAAFRRLGDPYGWGGTKGARDCSRLVLDLLRVFGIRVGRNSGIQARYGSEIIDVTSQDPDSKRRAIREAATRGVVLLYMPGHIMVYVGEDAGEDYALSSISEYVTPCSSMEDYVNRLDRVAVTPLSIGKDTVRKSFIERITSIQVFGSQPSGD